MTEFVDRCRREWKRLRVPRDVADEMAAELAADLAEAPASEVLGADADDPRAFAARWAAERGVARPLRRLLLTAVLALVVVAAVGGVLAITAPHGRSTGPNPLPLRMTASATTVWVTASDVEPTSGSGTQRALGSALLAAGLGGIAALAVGSRRIRGA